VISIVDDDESVREATKSLVRSLGYAARTFASAEEFLRSGSLDQTDCLITDVHMTGLSGVELQRLLIRERHRIPIIFVTADEKSRSCVLGAGAIGFLGKPFSDEALIDCLEMALTRSIAGELRKENT